MPDNFENFAPYAPGAAITGIIDQHRLRGLANPVTLTALERIGVKPTMTSRSHQTLRFLGLIDEAGNHLPAMDILRRATTEEFPSALAEVVQAAYLPVFTSVDPAMADDIRLADAFRGFEPATQRDKMIALFRALCEKAGLMPAVSRRTAKRTSDSPAVRRTPTPKNNGITSPPAVDPPPPPIRQDLRMVSAVFEQLPQTGKWTAERRERWLAAMTAAVDLLVEVEA
jgi:hypothetical protein